MVFYVIAQETLLWGLSSWKIHAMLGGWFLPLKDMVHIVTSCFSLFALAVRKLDLNLGQSSRKYNANFTLCFITFPSTLTFIPIPPRIVYSFVILVLRAK